MKHFKVLKHGNQYTENTRSWHQVIDFSWFAVGQTVSVVDLAKMHQVAPEYYSDVSELIEDGYIEPVNDGVDE